MMGTLNLVESTIFKLSFEKKVFCLLVVLLDVLFFAMELIGQIWRIQIINEVMRDEQ